MKLFRIALFVVISALFATNAMAAPKKVYLVNGLLSKALGYGLTNLSKKIPYARHFKFAGSVTAAAVNGIIDDATRAYQNDPSTQISLIGISQGANAVSRIAAALNKNGVPVHYLAIIEGGSMSPIYDNVRKADNFICTDSACSGKPLRRGGGNSRTVIQVIKLNTGHIDSGNHPKMHSRVISQI
ncbi:MAG: hypothetical protein WBC71_13670 [Salaquimonas sp.]